MMPGRTALASAVNPPLELPALEPGWWRTKSVGYWIFQAAVYLVAVGVDWVLTSLDGSSLAFQFGPVTVLGLLLLMGIGYLPIMVRRRWPAAVFALIWAMTLALDLTREAQPVLGLLVTLHAVAAFCNARVAQVALLSTAVPISVQSYWTAHYVDADHTTADFMVPFVFFSVLFIAVWLMGRREHRAQLAAVALQRQVELTQQIAAEMERQHLARELHDILSHSVSAMMMQAAGARAVAAALGRAHPEEQRLSIVQDALDTIEKTGSQSMRELHRLLGILREDENHQDGDEESVLELPVSGSAGHPGILDLQELVDVSRQSGLTIQLHHTGQARVLDPSVNAAAYRVIQESLTNALKHAGRGAVVDLFETWADDHFQLQVRSRAGHDAAKPGTPGSGTGLFGLRERVALGGGRFESGWVGDEFVTTATFPLTGASPLTLDRKWPRFSRTPPTS